MVRELFLRLELFKSECCHHGDKQRAPLHLFMTNYQETDHQVLCGNHISWYADRFSE